MSKPKSTLLVVVVLALAAPATAALADSSPSLSPPERVGLTGGLAVGMGEIHEFRKNRPDQFAEGGGFSLRFGKAMSQSTLSYLLISHTTVGSLSTTLFGGAGHFYLDNRWWLLLGGGLTRYVVSTGDEPESPVAGPGVLAKEIMVQEFSAGGIIGLGVDWLQLKTMALTAEFNVMSTYIDFGGTDNWEVSNSLHLMLGIQWY
ncbi:MAG TPA: hypothetical protein VML75_13190 [Kofleriaceae bacterium]|nr:hypothetical protein [Kofleriaceae bacterium]